MLLESTTFWLIVFYAFVGTAIGLVLLVYKLLNRSPFRMEDGEFIGVGYEEDGMGRVIRREPGPDIDGNSLDDSGHTPHIAH